MIEICSLPKAKTKAVADADTEGIILEKLPACFTSAVWKQFGFVVTTNQAGVRTTDRSRVGCRICRRVTDTDSDSLREARARPKPSPSPSPRPRVGWSDQFLLLFA